MTAHAVSIVVPCYNGGGFLDGLMAAIDAQTFRDFEVIIVDDGSTNRETAEKLADLAGSVRVVWQDNRGLAGARNTGFQEARSELVLPLDCDDMIDPTFLDELVRSLAGVPDAGFAFTHMRLMGVRSGIRQTRFDRFDQLFVNQLPYCMLIRKSAWQQVGGYDEAMRDGYEDWEFNIRLAAAGFRGIEIPRPLFTYRESSEGMLRRHSVRMHGTLWRRIRTKHAALYTLPALVGLWRSRTTNQGRVSAWQAASLLLLAMTMPERSFNSLFVRLLEAAQHRRNVTVESVGH